MIKGKLIHAIRVDEELHEFYSCTILKTGALIGLEFVYDKSEKLQEIYVLYDGGAKQLIDDCFEPELVSLLYDRLFEGHTSKNWEFA